MAVYRTIKRSGPRGTRLHHLQSRPVLARSARSLALARADERELLPISPALPCPAAALSFASSSPPSSAKRGAGAGAAFIWIQGRCSTAARITAVGAASWRPAAARSSAAAIATTTPRTRWRSTRATGTRSPATKSKRNIGPRVICSLCSKEQDVQQNCSNCGACMGKYFCKICKFFDDDVSKGQYHCDGCGICRTGGVDNFFHCDKCGCCYSNVLKDSHRCVERAMHHNCPVCFEYLFDSTKDISVLQCGHTIHLECMNEMRAHHHFSCPVCSRSACDMSATWRKLDEEVAATPMPDIYQKKMVWILCNDCSATSSVRFHVLGHKCPGCSSYNTRETRAACPRI